MTVKEFLEKVKEGPNNSQTLDFLMNLMILLEEFDSEACSTLLGKIKWQLEEANEASKKEIPLTDIIDILALGDKLDATMSEVYAIQTMERLEEVAQATGRTVPEIKNAVREYKKRR